MIRETAPDCQGNGGAVPLFGENGSTVYAADGAYGKAAPGD